MKDRNRGRWRMRVLVSLMILLGVSACGSDPAAAPGSSLAAASSSAAGVQGRTILDVRTPEEYGEGHLQGAVNIGLASGSFDQQIAALPKDAGYLVYCRTGVRSAEATARMLAAGFTDVLDAGAMSQAALHTNLPITTS